MWQKLLDWFKPKDEWFYGSPPYGTPRSWITEGMEVSKDGRGVISKWKYNSSYYRNLL